jgi:hypothetical protein
VGGGFFRGLLGWRLGGEEETEESCVVCVDGVADWMQWWGCV